MSDVLAFAGVTVRRGASTLLDDVTWEVEEGERWVVLGANGAGKTTLLQIAAARMHPSSGVAGVLGEVLGAVDVFELRPRIGLASSSIAKRIPAGGLVGNVVVTASYGIIGRWRETYDDVDYVRAMELLKTLGADHLADRPYGTLSEGERKRVQIARALMTDPELMLLDELAADTEAPAMVLVTHHVEEIPPSFTDVLMIRNGRVVAAGPIPVTLIAENLSATFGLPLVLEQHGERWSARAES